MRHYSLGDIRSDLDVELRNPATNPRYSVAELDVAIQRAANVMGEYFYIEQVDTSQSFTDGIFSYDYDFPVKDIYRVELIETSTTPIRVVEDWTELTKVDGCTLYFAQSRGVSTIQIWYERHPYPYPSDLTLDDGDGVNTTDTAFVVDQGTSLDWPSAGFAKIGNEFVKYTSFDRSTLTLTVVRGQLDSIAAAHVDGVTLSFVNEMEKPAFIEGVKEVAIKFLNRTRIVDAPSGDIAGNVTIMREIDDGMRQWIRDHRMRSKKQAIAKTSPATPMRGRRRGRR